MSNKFQTDILLEVHKFLERNEVEKSQHVSKKWYNVLKKEGDRSLKQRRRVNTLIVERRGAGVRVSLCIIYLKINLSVL